MSFVRNKALLAVHNLSSVGLFEADLRLVML